MEPTPVGERDQFYSVAIDWDEAKEQLPGHERA